jgi:hypothetical protein
VIKSGRDDLVASLQSAADGTRQHEVERSHVWPEDDLLGAATEKARCGRAGIVNHGACPSTRLVRKTNVSAGLLKVLGSGVANFVRHLSTTGRIKEYETTLQRRKARTNFCDVYISPSL